MEQQSMSGSDKYMIIKTLGSGSQGKVYLVEDKTDQNAYAMKVGSDKALMRQESQLLQRLRYPAFPVWKDYFEEVDGCLVMEYVEGITLREYMQKKKRADQKLTEYIMEEVLRALEYLHKSSTQVIYRDLKPENIMIDRAGNVRIVDLGSAASKGFLVGNYGYGAPEQFWEGAQPNASWDLYAAGKLLGYLLTGKEPGQPPYDMLEYCEKDPHISPGIYKVLQRSMADELLGRYDTAAEFLRDLKSVLEKKERNMWKIFAKKHRIVFEKCVWKAEYQRIF